MPEHDLQSPALGASSRIHTLSEVTDPTLASETHRFEEIDSRLLVESVEREVAAMNPVDRLVYRALLHSELSYVDTAAELGISVASVKKRAHRVRTRLRSRFGGDW